MTNNSNQLTQLLTMILMFMVIALLVLVGILIIVQVKKRMQLKRVNNLNTNVEEENPKILSAKTYTKESILNFMEFDKIQDNMIVQKNGMRYLMVIQCQGINYDLMSQAEKMGVEQGFQQFLNTLRHPVQIYVQTRTVNLESSLQNYRAKLKEIGDKLKSTKAEYERMKESDNYSEDELNKYFLEVTKQTNMYEYGKDIILNTEKMSQNKSVLNKQYYVIIPYYAEDLTGNNLDKEETKNMSFSELYSRAQSIIRTLSICGINSRILTSEELIELLYVAYNRDETEIFGIDKMARARYDELYSTAEDVLDKRMKELDKKIQDDAIQYANEKIREVKLENEKERELREKEEKYSSIVRDMARIIVSENSDYIGEEIASKAEKKIEKDIEREKRRGRRKE